MASDIRVGISGCAGTGKSSLAKELSAKLGLPFVKAKDITQAILQRDGYDYSSGIQIERFLANTGRQNEMLRMTIEQQSVASFVTDRTVVDLAAYAICEVKEDIDVVRHIVNTCRRMVSMYTHLIVCPWQDSVAYNGKRTLNPWYQYLIHAVDLGLLTDWSCPYVVLKTQTTTERVQESISLIS